MILPYPSLRQGLVLAWLGDRVSTAPADEARRSRLVWNGANPTLQNGGVTFDAVGNYIGVTERTGLSGNVPITVSAWARPTSTSAGGVFRFAGVSSGIRMTSGIWSFFGDSAAVFGPSSGGAITANVWQHVLYTYPGTVYENCLCYFSGSGPFTVTRTNGTANTGMSWVSGGASHIGMNNFTAYFPGQIADVRIYNRVLTMAEIRLLASRRGIGLSPSAPLHDDDADLQSYPIADPPNRVHANVDGVWVPGQVRANSSGTWGNGETKVNQGGVWPARQYHPESLFWRSRVEAGGGTVSDTTLDAVSTFCSSIDAAGIRDRFARLNLFCGTGLSACLTPLYLSLSYQGGVLGNATDRNFNFVAGDYVETGGLKGNGTSKYLDTGVVPSASLLLGNTHLSTFIEQAPVSGSFPVLISSQSASALFQLVSCTTAPSTGEAYFCENLAAGGFSTTVVNPTGLFVGSAVSLSDRRCYLNGSQSGATQTASPASLLPNRTMFVFANNNGSPLNYNNGRLSAYSIGLGMTAAQVAAFNSALATFRTAMGRS